MKKIDMKVLRKIAPAYFDAAKAHLVDFGALRDFTGNIPQLNRQMISLVEFSGLAPVDLLYSYNEDLLNYDGFRMMAIMYSGMCIILGKESISISELRSMMSSIIESMPDGFTHNDMIQFMSQHIEIDQSIIPSNIKIDMAKETEERKANELCINRANIIRRPNAGETYESYKSFIEDQASTIIGILNDDGYMHSYPVDVFTSLLMLYKFGMTFAKMYCIGGGLPMPKEVMNALSQKLFQANLDGGISGIIGPFIGGDDS